MGVPDITFSIAPGNPGESTRTSVLYKHRKRERRRRLLIRSCLSLKKKRGGTLLLLLLILRVAPTDSVLRAARFQLFPHHVCIARMGQT